MRALAIVAMFTTSLGVVFAQGEAGIPAPFQPVRLEWAKPAVLSAASRQYCGWSRQSLPGGAVRAAVEAAAPEFGFSVMAPAQQCASRHSEAATPGFDPRYAPSGGNMRGVQALLQVTVNFSGFYKGQEVAFRGFGAETRRREERAKVELTAVLLDVETREQTASSQGAGEHKGQRFAVRVNGSWIDQSEPARIEKALEAAVEQLLYGLNQQAPTYFGATGPRPASGVRVVEVDGSKLTLAMVNGTDITDIVSLGRMYYLLGEPVPGARGRTRIASIVIEYADADIAEARIVELFGNPAPGPAALQLVPYQQ